MARTTHAGLVHIQAECDDCDFRQNRKNAKGLAAQHADRTGHTVRVEEGFATTYNRKPKG